MKKLLVLLVVFASFNSFSNVEHKNDGFNYKKLQKKHKKAKLFNIHKCRGFQFIR